MNARICLLVVLSLGCTVGAHGAVPADRPNILWISLEDITPMMGCYGDGYARTPVFDKLAAEGIRYTSAHSIAPVCSVSRSSIITGMYPSSLGTIHHRSKVKPPAFLKMLPNLLREAGYCTSNNAKTDYNLGGAAWHESSRKAHWRNRPDKEQPFFAVFNYGACHSSITKIPEEVIVRQRLNRLKSDDFHDPAEAPIPPYHPDVPEFRKAWSRYYDAVTQVDYQAGEIITQLKEDGLWDNTIVFVWADHGVGMPRGKHNAWEQGTHVPLIVRFPKEYQHLAPAKPGSAIDGLVTLMDLSPSTLALAGLETPAWMHGRPLLCKGKESRTGNSNAPDKTVATVARRWENVENSHALASVATRNPNSVGRVKSARPTDEIKYRDYIIGVRDRLDTRYEMVRSVRDQRYRYQRNFYPHLPFKPYEDFEFNAPVLKKWVELAKQGKLTGPQAMLNLRFKPIEELYDSENDPHMINNVIDDPQYADVVKRMRRQLHDWMLQTRDLGILDETELTERITPTQPAGKSTLQRVGGKIATVSSSHPGMTREKMLDGSTRTFWHTRFGPTVAAPPHYVVFEVPGDSEIAGLVYTARDKMNGRIRAYEVYVSEDGKDWGVPIVRGKCDPTNPKPQTIAFPEPVTTKFIRFQVVDAVSADSKSLAAIGELDVLLNERKALALVEDDGNADKDKPAASAFGSPQSGIGSPWDLGQSLKNYERILDTADLQVQGKAATAELLARADDPDSAVRFWAVLGLVALQSDDAKVVSALQAATKDRSVSVRITAADGLFNLGRYEDGLPAIIAALEHPLTTAQIRAGCVLDTQPPEANEQLQPAIEPLRQAVRRFRQEGRFGGTNNPFKRALKAITGEETYYRWGPGESGSPVGKEDN